MPEQKRSVLGRIIVKTVFAGFAAWFVIAMFGSMISNLYGQPVAAHAGPLTIRERNKCIGAIVGLRKELEGVVTLELGHPLASEHPTARWNVWVAGWDEKLAAARGGCTGTGNASMDRAFDELAEMRRDYGDVVETFIRTRSGLTPRLDGTVQELRQQP